VLALALAGLGSGLGLGVSACSDEAATDNGDEAATEAGDEAPTDNTQDGPAEGHLSFGSFPGWVQDEMPPDSVDYGAWTHILHFGMYPTSSGEVAIADMQSAEFPPAAVAAAHAEGRKIILVIGGEGTGEDFVAATEPSLRPTFVQDIVATMQRYGYDGVSIDWEENVVEDQFTALVGDVRAELDKVGPRPFLSVDVLSGLVEPRVVATVADSVDTVNLMSYWSNGHDELDAYLAAGIPAGKLVLGIGLSADYHDTSVESVQDKVDLVVERGLAGVEVWSFADLRDGWQDPRLEPLHDLAGRAAATG
jgi:hypothetical protein